MADFSESDYGMGDYGDGFYSYLPITLFDSEVWIPFDAWSNFVAFAFRDFSATASFSIHTVSVVSVNFSIGVKAFIPFYAVSNEYLGRFWEEWIPVSPGEGGWVPDIPVGDTWVPDIPLGDMWVPDVSVNSVWASDVVASGFWIPVGPDLTPNR